MEEIIRFVSLAQTDRFTLTDLCAQFSISRKTGHKWRIRYREVGLVAGRETSNLVRHEHDR